MAKTNNVVLAVGATAGAVMSIVAVVVLVKPGATPAVKFAQAQVESDYTPLEQYESLHQPGSTSASGGDWSPRPALDYGAALASASPPAAPAAAASPPVRPAVRLAVYVTPGASAASTRSATVPMGTYPASGAQTGTGSSGEPEGGAMGASGSTGASGPTGATGAMGVTGSTGPTGHTGSTGSTSKERQERREAAEAAQRKLERERRAARERRETLEAKRRGRRIKGTTGPTSGSAGEPAKGGRFVAPPRPATPFHQEGGAKVLVGTGASTGAVDAVLEKVRGVLAAEHAVGRSGASVSVQTRCGDSCALRPLIDRAIMDTSANPAEAAREIAGIFTDTRSGEYEHRREPVGVTVDYAIDFSHYVGRTVTVVWTLDSRATGEPLPRSWWRNVVVKQVEPTSDEPYRGNFWAPLPRKEGDYYVTLRLFAGEREVGSIPTGVFH